MSQRQRERRAEQRAEQRAERAKNKPIEEPKAPKPIKSTPKPLTPPKKVGIKGEAVRRSKVKEKRVLAVDIPKPILIKKLGWIMSEERKYVLSEVLYGITPSKKASDIRDALEYFERVLFTADQLEVFGTRLRKFVVTMNLNEPKNQIKVSTERQNETIIGFKFEDEWGKIMFARFKEIKGNYCESN